MLIRIGMIEGGVTIKNFSHFHLCVFHLRQWRCRLLRFSSTPPNRIIDFTEVRRNRDCTPFGTLFLSCPWSTGKKGFAFGNFAGSMADDLGFGGVLRGEGVAIKCLGWEKQLEVGWKLLDGVQRGCNAVWGWVLLSTNGIHEVEGHFKSY